MALLPILLGAGALYSAYRGAKNQGKSNELNDQALELARADYEDRKPLRQAFTQGAMTPIAQAPDLTSVFSAARSDNPFATGGAPRSAHVPSQLDFSGIDVTPRSGPAGGNLPVPDRHTTSTEAVDMLDQRFNGSAPDWLKDRVAERYAPGQQQRLHDAGGPKRPGESMSDYIKRVNAPPIPQQTTASRVAATPDHQAAVARKLALASLPVPTTGVPLQQRGGLSVPPDVSRLAQRAAGRRV